MQRSHMLLFTPGPLNTSPTVRQAMLEDMGSRDEQFIQLIASVRDGILAVGGVHQRDGFEAIPLQGSGTYAIESVLTTAIGPEDRQLILVNGAYGRRIVDISACHRLNYEVYEVPENCLHDASQIEALLKDSRFDFLTAVHCETTTGILNPIAQWGSLARQHGCKFIVDAMSSFGGVSINLAIEPIDYLISSANKCLQGVPGLAFVIARRAALMSIRHSARTVSLDILQQLLGFEKLGQFRFTPPTHIVLALEQALKELKEEGGVEQRASRYRQNHEVLCDGMRSLGFRPYVARELQSHIITAFLYPDNPRFDFNDFYKRLARRSMVIYPGKLTQVDCFRIGSIGHLFADDMRELLSAIEAVLFEMQLTIPV